MEVIHSRCAGMDVSKRDAKVCVRIAGGGRRKTVETVRTWAATTNSILALREHLVAEQVSLVVMEATSDYWKPFYYLLEEAGFEVMLVNARQVKNLPGRKTDVSDAAWLAQLGAHGLVRGSLVPPAPIRELRDLTRARTMMARERGREIQRLEKLLEDAGIKLSSVASDITGVSGRLMLQALIDGQRNPAALADLAKRRLRAKIPELTEALTGRFSDHHAFLAQMYLDAIDQRSQAITELTVRIEMVIEPFRSFCHLIGTIPGVGVRTAEVIVAETGADMSVFPDRRPFRIMGGNLPRQPRVRRPRQIDQDPTRQPLPQSSPRHRRLVHREHAQHLLGGEVPTDRHQTRTAESHRRRRTRHLDRDLEHGPHRSRILRPRSRLLHPPRSRTAPTARDPPTATPRLQRHPQPDRRISIKRGLCHEGNLRVR
jgi:transposase